MSSARTASHLWFTYSFLFPEKYNPSLFFDERESRLDARGGNLAPLEAASSDCMFLEDTQIDLPYSCHAMTRSWLVHGFADQGARLYVGDTLASPSTLFHIDHHADHTHPESGARVGNLAHCACSSAISGNVRIFGGNPLIWNYQFWLCRGFAIAHGGRLRLSWGLPLATRRPR